MDTTHLKNIFENMMPYIRALYDPTGVPPYQKPYYIYGRKHEVLTELTNKDRSIIWKENKFPLVILYHSQIEDYNENILYYSVSPLISIVTGSLRKFTTNQRYTNSVENILYPIKDLLIQEIADNPAFYQSYTHEIDHEVLVWDGNPSDNTKEGVIYNDYLDGINININNLLVSKNRTCG